MKKTDDIDIFNCQYLHRLLLSSTHEYTNAILIRHRFYPTLLKNKKRLLVQFHTTDKKLRTNFGSDFLLCASTDNYRYFRINVLILRMYEIHNLGICLRSLLIDLFRNLVVV